MGGTRAMNEGRATGNRCNRQECWALVVGSVGGKPFKSPTPLQSTANPATDEP